MKVTFTKSEPAADNITTFYFTPQTQPHYVAGQFTELRLPHADRDGRGDKRWYTLSSSPTEELLAITTKFAADDGSSFKRALRQLQPGAEVDMAAPMGDFVLPKDPSIPLTFVAGGIGATPFRSMLRYCRDEGEDRDIRLIYSAGSEGEIAFRDTFEALGDKFIPVTGERLTAGAILEMADPGDSGHVYLSGPEPMIEALQKDLRAAGFDKRRIQSDFFPGYTAI